MEFALLLQACLLMSTLETFSYDVLFWFFWGFFFVQCRCSVVLLRAEIDRTNHAFALLMKCLATGKATPKQGTIMFQLNSVQGLFLLLFFKCILGSGCFYSCQKVASFESWTCGCNRVSFVDQLVLLPYVCYSFDFYMHLYKWRKK